MNQITIGYLSWKRHSILDQTLHSHKINGLLEIVGNRFIYFQEICNNDVKIANQYDCSYIGTSENVGILRAFISMIEHCTTEYFIFCENDWYLIEQEEKTRSILEDAIHLLNTQCDVVKLRHKIHHGVPLYSKPSDPNSFLKVDVSGFPYKLESLSWVDDPVSVYGNAIKEYIGNNKWYITTLEHQRWSNNVFICKTASIKEKLIPLLKYYISENDKYGALEILLTNYKSYFGKSSELDTILMNYSTILLAGGDGLFMHKDT